MSRPDVTGLNTQDVDVILLDRLMRYISLPVRWFHAIVSVADVERYMAAGGKSVTEPYPMREHADPRYDRAWHLGRVTYFVRNPDKITPITLDCLCDMGVILPIPTVIDGHHRLLAALVLRRKTVEAKVNGLMNVIDYLTGYTDVVPEEFD